MIPSPAPPRQAVRRWGSRVGAAAVALVGLLLSAPARPAFAAADTQVTVTISQRWQLAGTQGTWTPYLVTVRDVGQAGFTGDLYLVPNDTRSVAPYTYPTYHSPITVARGSQRTTVFNVIDSPGGYSADVRDGSGRVPLRPTSTATASLSALAELAGRSTDATAQVASGQLGSGRVALAAADGTPLVVEGSYGPGRVVELTFDPFAEPFDSQVELAGMAWSNAISRALSGVQGGSRSVPSNGFGSSISSSSAGLSAAPGSWAPGFTSSADQIATILSDQPSLAPPPVGLLGGLLVAYVLPAGVLNYLFLKAAGRRHLMWISVPLMAIVFTVAAYGVGFGSRGSDFLVTEVQVQRMAPEGAVESYTFEAVYPPRKGDVTLTLPGNTLVSTAVAVGTFADSRGDALITVGSH